MLPQAILETHLVHGVQLALKMTRYVVPNFGSQLNT